MKITKAARITFLRRQLATNGTWAVKAMVRIYNENQTTNERSLEATTEDNGIGFTGTDGQILSSFAKQVNGGRSLSTKQMAIVFKKMGKYARQVLAFSDVEKLDKMIETA